MGYNRFSILISIALALLPCLLVVACSNTIEEACTLNRIERLQVIPTINVGTDTCYTHDILIEGYHRSCMDSTSILNIAHTYMDTVTQYFPITGIMFFSTDENYDQGEATQNPDEVGDDILVRILFNKDGDVELFVFFKESGFQHPIYIGKSFTKGKHLLLE
jgi:hypothetical protein